MDETDVILSSLLLVNSRTPYRELAEQIEEPDRQMHGFPFDAGRMHEKSKTCIYAPIKKPTAT